MQNYSFSLEGAADDESPTVWEQLADVGLGLVDWYAEKREWDATERARAHEIAQGFGYPGKTPPTGWQAQTGGIGITTLILLAIAVVVLILLVG